MTAPEVNEKTTVPAGTPPPQPSKVGRFFSRLLVRLLILTLLGAIGYLLSVINHGRYRLNPAGQSLRIERGRMLPLGYVDFKPPNKQLQKAYAPIEIQPKAKLKGPMVFGDRAELDQELFNLLGTWARKAMPSEDIKVLRRAATYIDRAGLLPAISEKQRTDLKTMRADLAYRNGRRMVEEVLVLLQDALAEFYLAVELGSSKAEEATTWIKEIRRRITVYEDTVRIHGKAAQESETDKKEKDEDEEEPEDPTDKRFRPRVEPGKQRIAPITPAPTPKKRTPENTEEKQPSPEAPEGTQKKWQL